MILTLRLRIWLIVHLTPLTQRWATFLLARPVTLVYPFYALSVTPFIIFLPGDALTSIQYSLSLAAYLTHSADDLAVASYHNDLHNGDVHHDATSSQLLPVTQQPYFFALR